jgi:integrase
MEKAGGRDSRNCADFVRFLANSGCRRSEARQVRWMDIDWETGTVAVRNGKQRLTSSADPTRHVPIVEDLGRLLARLKQEPHAPEDAICKVRECQKSLDRACRTLDVPRLTHHDLRHLFATCCIESGVDIPTVSRWLGHVDGGALAMRTYGHLRNEHSLAMAKQVKF